MSTLQERIAQFRKMANDDPDNELGHFRLGQLLMEDGQYGEAVASLRRTLEIEPNFSKVYQLLGLCQMKLGQRDEAVRVLKEGWAVADARGDKMPRDEIGRMLVELGEPLPESAQPAGVAGAGDGFPCQRPGCPMGNRGRKLTAPPLPDDLGRKIQESICADCWDYWFRNYSIKVINELRLDLSTEHGQEEYDKHMRDFLGFEPLTTPV